MIKRDKKNNYLFDLVGNLEYIGLLIILLLSVVLISKEIFLLATMKIEPTLAEILMMFIYLEVLAMVGVYLKTGKLPIRLPIYIAIVAIARYIIIELKTLSYAEILFMSGSILILTISVLAMKYAHNKFQLEDHLE